MKKINKTHALVCCLSVGCAVTAGAGIGIGYVIGHKKASPPPLASLSVNWRTEDYEGKVNNPLSETREWIWLDAPAVGGGYWGIDQSGDQLPEGIHLSKATGQLTGMPVKAGTYNVIFTYSVGGYNTAKSNPISFLILDKDAGAIDVIWNSDLSFDHNVNIAQINGIRIYKYVSDFGGTWSVRQPFSLPDGLQLDPSAGTIYGQPTQAGQSEISFDYKKDNFVENISAKLFINVNYIHTINLSGTSSGLPIQTTNDLTIRIASLSNSQMIMKDFQDYLWGNDYSDATNAIDCSGTVSVNGTDYAFSKMWIHFYGYDYRYHTRATKDRQVVDGTWVINSLALTDTIS